jgi:hypothetical protein
VRFAEAEGPQRGGVGLPHGAVDLVRGQHDGLGCPAQDAHHALVRIRHAHRRVDDEDHHVGRGRRDLGLGADPRRDAFRLRVPPPGVDEGEPASRPARVVRDAVSGDAGDVLDDGLTAAEDAVHQRRLADVGPSDDRDDRQRAGVPLVDERLVVGEQICMCAVRRERLAGHTSSPPAEAC